MYICIPYFDEFYYFITILLAYFGGVYVTKTLCSVLKSSEQVIDWNSTFLQLNATSGFLACIARGFGETIMCNLQRLE